MFSTGRETTQPHQSSYPICLTSFKTKVPSRSRMKEARMTSYRHRACCEWPSLGDHLRVFHLHNVQNDYMTLADSVVILILDYRSRKHSTDPCTSTTEIAVICCCSAIEGFIMKRSCLNRPSNLKVNRTILSNRQQRNQHASNLLLRYQSSSSAPG